MPTQPPRYRPPGWKPGKPWERPGLFVKDNRKRGRAGMRERAAVLAFIQQGGTAGTIVAVRAPQTRFENPEVDRGADEVRMDLTGQCLISAAAVDDAISFAFG